MTARLVRHLGGRLAFGGDYNPEQWDEAVWREDDELMRRARVNLATVGVFSWALLEPAEGHYAFGWLDAQLDRLHAQGVAVDLATPTASPPPWFTLAHPDAMPVTADGVRLTHGSRDTYCLAAPAYRRAARALAAALAERYAGHPAVAMWHVHNEYATVCWCDHAAAAFRRWLRARHGTLDAVNAAWGTAFWSQRYATWEEIQPPRATQWHRNPGLTLDYRRFWSDEALAAYREQRDAIRAAAGPERPITTNLMLPGYQTLDLWAFGREVDFVGVDHYPDTPGTGAAADTAFGADRARSFGGGKPWLLVEQGTSTVYTGDRTLPKEPGEMLRHTLGHIARGSEGALFFQWRQSKAGAELWHSAMVPHAGPDSRIFREVAATGAAVARLAEVAGSRVHAGAAVLHDADAWWAKDTQGRPSPEPDYLGTLRRAHRTLWEAGVTTDFAHPRDPDLSRYALVVAPALYLLSDETAESLRRYVEAGGTLLVQCFSGVVDEHHQARLGGYPAAPLREALGIRVEELRPLAAGARARLSDGSTGTAWSESVRLGVPAGGDGGSAAETVAAYTEGMLAGQPAVTRHAHGAGTAWYVSTQLDDDAYRALLGRLTDEAGVRPELAPQARTVGGDGPGVEAVRRRAADGTARSWLFLLNHTAEPVHLPPSALPGGHDLLTGHDVPPDGLILPAGGAAVIRQEG
ncbi:beta-galactosidase [Streptomyces sp. NPDC020917]|uniref:beta-galactosidase n=1 Tax=Streptomyces sp. NPDC020917 TaxID=3365102 RepID=UPI0037A2BA38